MAPDSGRRYKISREGSDRDVVLGVVGDAVAELARAVHFGGSGGNFLDALLERAQRAGERGDGVVGKRRQRLVKEGIAARHAGFSHGATGIGQDDVRYPVVALVDTARNPAQRLQRLQLPRERARVHAQPLNQSLLRQLACVIVQREQDAPTWHWMADLRLERLHERSISAPKLLYEGDTFSLVHDEWFPADCFSADCFSAACLRVVRGRSALRVLACRYRTHSATIAGSIFTPFKRTGGP